MLKGVSLLSPYCSMYDQVLCPDSCVPEKSLAHHPILVWLNPLPRPVSLTILSLCCICHEPFFTALFVMLYVQELRVVWCNALHHFQTHCQASLSVSPVPYSGELERGADGAKGCATGPGRDKITYESLASYMEEFMFTEKR